MKVSIDFKNIKWMKRLSWLGAVLFMIGGSIFTTIMVQYVILDASLYDNLSTKKWQLNVICVLIFYLSTIKVSRTACTFHNLVEHTE